MTSQYTYTESQGKNREFSDQGHDHPRVRRPVLRRSNPRLLAADRIEAQGRIAQVPCTRCYVRGTLCLVGSNSKRCAACARSGIRLDDCGVDRDNYRYDKLISPFSFAVEYFTNFFFSEFPIEDEDEDDDDENSSSNETSVGPEPEDTPMEGVSHTCHFPDLSMAGGESSAASDPNTQNSNVLLKRKIEWVNEKTMELLIPVTSDMTDMKDQIFSFKKNMKQLYGRIRTLEETVATLAGLRPRSG